MPEAPVTTTEIIEPVGKLRRKRHLPVEDETWSSGADPRTADVAQ
jgi:hypothetical protein